jgi:glutamine synthetase
MKIKLEYVWMDGNKPESNLRSKTKVMELDKVPTLEELPNWSFDGSSTNQAKGHNSDCVLKPVRMIKDPQRSNALIVLCEVINPDGSAHPTNTRSLINEELDSDEMWFGLEQEYTILKDGKPFGFPEDGYPEPQGKYYCGVGGGVVSGRKIAEEHLDACLAAGLNITGINAEVMLGQWEYQIFGKGAKRISDDLWLSRFILNRISEFHGLEISLHPKPVKGDWNGSGMHCNFSDKQMREEGGKELFETICYTLDLHHEEHINVYGEGNDERLTGKHETQHINTFSYGVSDRGASIRIPVSVIENDWKGYLEDRRPASNADPYKVTSRIISTLFFRKEFTEHQMMENA